MFSVRGMGCRYEDEGKMTTKINTFTDFISCAEHLVGKFYGPCCVCAISNRRLAKPTALTTSLPMVALDSNLTSPEQLAINGASAGGLLMGAVVNMAYVPCAGWHAVMYSRSCYCALFHHMSRPEGLFRCVVAEVPFVDVLQTMSDPSIPLTVRFVHAPPTIRLVMTMTGLACVCSCLGR